MYELVQWGNYTHYHAGTGMTSALILCVLHDDIAPGSWLTSNHEDVPSRQFPGSSTIINSDEPPTCKWCQEVATNFNKE